MAAVAAAWLVGLTALATAPSSPPPNADERPAALDDLSLRRNERFGSREGDELRAWLIGGAPLRVVRGAETYAAHCAVCHGDTGLGYAEAKLAFPVDHRSCTRCHRPGNERTMSFETMMERQHDLFDLGDPPALRGPGTLAGLGADAALFAYTRATMPRYDPGRLSDDDVRDLVDFMRWIAVR